jgi:beta-phosphoglucomutase
VENAPLGIRSARAAGAWCIGLTSTVGADDLREADEIVASHEQLRERLFALCAIGQRASA